MSALLSACGGGGTYSPTAKPPDTGAVGSAFWIPFTAVPRGPGGRAGLFVVPSDALDSPPTFVATPSSSATPIQVIAEADNYAVSGTAVGGFSPALLMYAAPGSDGAEHIYGVNIGNAASAPAAVQLSSLSFSSTQPATSAGLPQLCNWHPAQTDLAEPTTLFAILVLAGSAGCGARGGPYAYFVVHYGDSVVTAPLNVTMPNPFFTLTPLYSPGGQLGGMVSLDPGSETLYFYANDTFSSPKVLLSGVTAANTIYAPSVTGQGVFPSTEFLALGSSSSPQTLYQISYQGSASKWYTAAGPEGLGGGASDGTYFYFFDQNGESIWKESVAGGTPEQLLHIDDGYEYIPVGSTGAQLVLNWGAGTFAQSSWYGTIPIDAASTSVNQVWTTSLGSSTAFLAPSAVGTTSPELLFITVRQYSLPSAPTSITSYSEVVTPDGVVKQPLMPKSGFVGAIGTSGSEVLEVTGIADTTGGSFEGGTLNVIDAATLASSPVKTPAGAAYTVSQGPTFVPLSSTLSAKVDPGDGAVLDGSSKVIYPMNLPNTTVSTAWF